MARAMAGPTAVCQANPILPSESGAERSRAASADGMAVRNGCNEPEPDRERDAGAGRRVRILWSVSSRSVQLLLASASPRRRALLAAAGFRFDVAAVDVDERLLADEAPDAYVARLARSKARAASIGYPDHVVVAADTTVVADTEEVLGKPLDADQAAAMLRRLAGRLHTVLTGVTVRAGRREATAVDRTRVTFLPLSNEEIVWYVAGGEWHDKAGGYGIQGLASRFVARIDGSYGNVVGLPIPVVCRLLSEVGADEILRRTAEPGKGRRADDRR